VLAVAGILAGCGSSSSHAPTPPELALERAQFVQVSHALRSTESIVQREVKASRGVWPSISNGLPTVLSPSLKAAVSKATATAKTLPEEPIASDPSKLTGPAAGITSIYESYVRLAERGWLLTQASILAIANGTPAQASFSRANSSLYIDAIYDSHYNLSLLGKSLLSGYEKLGGPAAFGGKLTQSEVESLASAYSIPAVRLQPHPFGGAEGG
jgi:hypothetical protein